MSVLCDQRDTMDTMDSTICRFEIDFGDFINCV